MEVFLKILKMYGIAFCISMFVAFVIWGINKLSEIDINKLTGQQKTQIPEK